MTLDFFIEQSHHMLLHDTQFVSNIVHQPSDNHSQDHITCLIGSK